MRIVMHDSPSGHLYRVTDGDPLGERCPVHDGGWLPTDRWAPSVTGLIDRLAWPGLEGYRRQRLAHHVALAAKGADVSMARAMQVGMAAERAENEGRMDRGTVRHAEIARAVATGEIAPFGTETARALTALRRHIPAHWQLHIEVPVIACSQAVSPVVRNPAPVGGWGGTIDLLAVNEPEAEAVIVDWKTSDQDHPRDLPGDRDRLQAAGYAAACLYHPHGADAPKPMLRVTEAHIVRFGQVSTDHRTYRPSGGFATFKTLAAHVWAAESMESLMDPDHDSEVSEID